MSDAPRDEEEEIGVVRVDGAFMHDVVVGRDHTKYKDKDGRTWFVCRETGKQYKSLTGLRGAARLRKFAQDVRDGKKPPPFKGGKRSRAFKGTKEESSDMYLDSYVIPKTSGPVFEYLRRNMEQFGVGVLPEEWPVRPYADTGSREMLELHRDVLSILKELYGDKWQILIRSLGVDQETVHYLEHPTKRPDGRGWTSSARAAYLRNITLVSLIHVYNIMETTREIERELWVALQRSHDIRIIPSDRKRPRIKRVKEAHKSIGDIRSVIGSINKSEQLLMPLRVRALIHYPDMEWHRALERERMKLMPDYWSDRASKYTTEELHEESDVEIHISDEQYQMLQKAKAERYAFEAEETERMWSQAKRDWEERRYDHVQRQRERKSKRAQREDAFRREFEEAIKEAREKKAKRQARYDKQLRERESDPKTIEWHRKHSSEEEFWRKKNAGEL